MIGSNHIGRVGRLGNQMFQYASMKGIARNRGYEYCLPPHETEPQPEKHLLFDVFNMLSLQHIGWMPKENGVGEAHFHFDEKLFNTCPDNVNVGGYLQSPKYFNHIENEIMEDFSFRPEYKIYAKMYMDEMKNRYGDNILCLNVRRGDYIHYPDHHPLCSLEYYEQALNMFNKDACVILVSDDKDWMEQQSLFQGERFHITNKKNHFFVDLCIMTMIDQHIISNSTFAWWGAWLSNKKKVIAPIKWFGTANSYADTKDLIPENWTRI
jgi:hypothetical protein